MHEIMKSRIVNVNFYFRVVFKKYSDSNNIDLAKNVPDLKTCQSKLVYLIDAENLIVRTLTEKAANSGQ